MELKNNLFSLFEYLDGDQGKVYLRQGDIFVKGIMIFHMISK